MLGLWLARRLARLTAADHPFTNGGDRHHGGDRWRRWDGSANPLILPSVLAPLVAGLVGWRLQWPGSFETQVHLRFRSWWRGQLIYRLRWTKAMDTAGLMKERHGTDYVPPLLWVRSTRSVDRVRVRMLPGQTVEDFGAVAERLAQTFGAEVCRVRSIPKRRHLRGVVVPGHRPARPAGAAVPARPGLPHQGDPGRAAEDGTI